MIFGVCCVSALEDKQVRAGNEHLSQHSPEKSCKIMTLRKERQKMLTDMTGILNSAHVEWK